MARVGCSYSGWKQDHLVGHRTGVGHVLLTRSIRRRDESAPKRATVAYGCAHVIWIIRGNGDAGVLRVREAQPLVRLGVCRRVCARFGLRISSRRLAVRTS